MDYTNKIKNYLELEIEVLKSLDQAQVNRALGLLMETRDKDGTVYVFGNGGSSSTASHFQNDFNKGVSEEIEQKFRFVCLNDNVATLMAIANDNGFENVFRQQLEGKLGQGDLIIAISGSGNSENVIRAVEYAKEQGVRVIGLTGYSGGKLKELSDVNLHVPIDNMQITEDVHLIYNHMMMYILYNSLTGKY
ncbi:MAG: SIS domain-containing protein [Lachnospiraceae bacterium]|nr:SIS domain-containing protein [Lachnospiraceae bacterium]